MSNSEELSTLDSFQDPGFLYPLLRRANDAAAVLAKYHYTGSSEWIAEAFVTITHGDNERELCRTNPRPYPRYKLTVQVRPYTSMRWLTLEEAEMIVERLKQQE